MSPLLLFLSAICLALLPSSLCLVSLDATVCDGSGRGPPADVLNRTISCLVSGAGYGSSVYCQEGEGRNRTYGFAQCSANAILEECSICLQDSGASILKACKGKPEAKIYRDNCVVFYQQRPFSDEVLAVSTVQGPDCGDAVGNLAQIGNLLDELVGDIMTRDASFAVESSNGEVFGLAQCWGIPGKACGDCLGTARDALEGICGRSTEGRVAYDRCLFHYQNHPFDSQLQVTTASTPHFVKSVGSPHASTNPPISTGVPIVKVAPNGRSNQALYFFLGGLSLLLVCLILLGIYWKSIKSAKLNKMLKHNKSARAPGYFSGNLRTISYFDYKILKKATKNFHPGNQLGAGGFGPVYQGKLEDGRKIAVKKLAIERSQQGETEFLAEVRMITSIQHKNLVRLLGCCSDGSQRLLVYEYMKNRSLDTIIYGKSDIFLNWPMRFQIILGIARGIQYLHEDSHQRIIHRDIKASNILLDDKFQPKIGDFGLARFFPEDQAYLSTTFAGTLGYTAPEYAIRGELSEKADIYSFGVLVLEIINGRKNTDLSLPSEMQYLPEYAWKLYDRLKVMELVDPNLLADEFVGSEALTAIHVAFLCIQPHPTLRPPMSKIVAMLTRKEGNIPTPVRPMFLGQRRRYDEDLSWEAISDVFPSPLKSDSPSFP